MTGCLRRSLWRGWRVWTRLRMLGSRVRLLYLAGQHSPRLSTMRTWGVLIPAGSTVERSILDDWEIDGSSPSRGTLPRQFDQSSVSVKSKLV